MGEENLSENLNWITTKKFFSEAILVALLTAVGYLAAFAYQYNYLRYFGVPVFFVDVNLTLVLFITLGGLIWSAFLGSVFNFLLTWTPRNNFLKNVAILLFLILGLFPLIASIYNPNNILISSLGFLIIVGFILVEIIILYKNREKLIFRKKERDKNDLIARAEQIYGSFPILFVGVLIIFIVYSSFMGTVIATNQSDYLVSNTDPAVAIVGTYYGNFVGLIFNPNTRSFDKNITILSQDKVSNGGIIFSSKKIGPLKPAEEIR